ncbi:MAG: AsmA family protein [Rickettsiales bacterium]|nr:AsmA family protein [Pseudomonadota bacterium]MDA0967040.1 AsmA family protein [Pseudomonadota bacterium]MDG4542474.1 AsmA family protein [Rickettsiales bacterium]MDG4544978.1 AsmA family protein [Rickettsiales bacterium]MDG4547101.1 AsmA family protein [Rickettsiales bacterium]
MKKLLILFTLFLFMIVAALLSVPLWLDVNKYKQDITKLIHEKTGFKVKIDGEITAIAVPDISLMVENVSVASSLDESRNLFASEKMVIQIKLAPLFDKKLEIESLQLIKPSVSLKVNKEGEANWEQKKAEKEVDKGAEKEAVDSNEVTEVVYGEEKPFDITERFLLNRFEIKDADFSYVDEQSEQNINISNLNIKTSIKPGENDFNLSGKLNIFEDKSKGIFDLSAKYTISGATYKLNNIDIKLDDIKANSEIEHEKINGKPSLKLSLYTNSINLNNYTMVSAKNRKVTEQTSVEEKEESTEEFTWDTKEFDVAFLNQADFNFNFKSGGIKYDNFEIGNIALNAYLKSGRLTLNFKDVSLYGGIMNSEVLVDGASGLPVLKTKFDIKSLNMQQVLKTAGQKEIFEGKTDIEGSLYSVGNTQKALIEKLSGKMSLNVKDGVIQGVDLISILKSKPDAFNLGVAKHTTRFEQISADFDIKNGLAVNENLVLKSDIINFAGRGEIDLPKQNIAYKLTPKYSQDFESNEEQKLSIPILISGHLLKPTIRLEVKSIVQDLINNPEGGKNLVNQLKRDFKDMKSNLGSEDGIKSLKDIFQ